jgi:amidohydrolase
MEKQLAAIKPNLFRIFNHLHTIPEISWKEYNTTAFLKELVDDLGISITSLMIVQDL